MKKALFVLGCFLVLIIGLVGHALRTSFEVRKAVQNRDFLRAAARVETLQKDVEFFDILSSRVFHNTYIQLASNIIKTVQLDLRCTDETVKFFNVPIHSADLQNSLYACIDETQKSIAELRAHPRLFSLLPRRVRDAMTQLETYTSDLKTTLSFFPDIFSAGTKRYLVLLQNNMELRPTGGFLGSFAVIEMTDGKLSSMKVEDIYVPDGQLKGYVKPPKPIEVYLFQTGGWKLRDANWDPDFPTAAQTLTWFFNRGGYRTIDGMIATNFSVFQKALNIIGPVYLPDYNQQISAENIYGFTQVRTESSFFPGAINKQSILGGTARAVMREVENADIEKRARLGMLVLDALRSKDIMVWSSNTAVQEKLHEAQWDGAVRTHACRKKNCVADNLYVVEANVGINKANCCVEREALYDVYLQKDGSVETTLTLSYVNNNPAVPDPPRSFGGGYKNYLRVLKNPEFQFVKASQDNAEIPADAVQIFSRRDILITETGLLALVEGGKHGVIRMQFRNDAHLDLLRDAEYTLLVQRQPGVLTNAYVVRVHYPDTYTAYAEQSDLTAPGYIEFRRTLTKDTVLRVSFTRN